MTNIEQNEIRELNETEVEAVSGAYSWAEFTKDLVSACNSCVKGFTDTMTALNAAKA